MKKIWLALALLVAACHSSEPNLERTAVTAPIVVAAAPSSAHFLTTPTDGLAFSGERWQFTRAGLITVYQPQQHLTVERVDIDGSQLPGQGWGIRAYDVGDWVVERCRFHDLLGLKNGIYKGEHGVYVNVAGNITIRGCFFFNIPGQAVQTVFEGRENESSNYELYLHAGGVIRVANCYAHWCGLPNPDHSQGGRAGYTFSFFPSSQSVEVVNCSIDNTGLDWWSVGPNSPRFNSYGGLLAISHPKVLIRDSDFTFDNPDRALVDVRNCDVVEIFNCDFNATNKSQVRISGAQHVEVSGCTGNASLWVDGKKLGPISAGYQR